MSTAAPSHTALLADFFELNFRIEDLIARHKLTPAQFLAFAKDPVVVDTLDTFELFQQRHQRIAARQHQEGAAGHLHQCILDSPSTIETRRAATALARLTAQMVHIKSPTPPDDSPPQPSDLQPSSTTAPIDRTLDPCHRSPCHRSPGHPAIGALEPPTLDPPSVASTARSTPTTEPKPTLRKPRTPHPADSP